jgi:acetolactate synthase small subunit
MVIMEASVEFVLAVLRQHEIEFEQIISQLELLVDTVNKVADQLQQKMENRLNLND